MSDQKLLQQIHDRVRKGHILTEVEEQELLKAYMRCVKQLIEAHARLVEVLDMESNQTTYHAQDLANVIAMNRRILGEAPKDWD